MADGTRDATPASRVEVEFIAKGEGTDLKLVHSALHVREASLGFGRGWEIALSSLSDLSMSNFEIMAELKSTRI